MFCGDLDEAIVYCQMKARSHGSAIRDKKKRGLRGNTRRITQAGKPNAARALDRNRSWWPLLMNRRSGKRVKGSGGERQSGPASEVKCGGGAGSESEFTVSSGAGRREYVANQC